MSHIMPNRTDVRAPANALAWSPTHGFIVDHTQLGRLYSEGALLLDVNAEGQVQDVEGHAPLVAVLRIEHDVSLLAHEVINLYERLLDAAEAAVDTLTRR